MKILQDIRIPLLSVNDQSLIVQELSFKTGEPVKQGDTIAVLETSKTTYTIEAETDGFIEYFCEGGDDVPVNAPLAKIFDSMPLPVEPVNPLHNKSDKKEFNGSTKTIRIENTIFSQAALSLIKELDLNEEDFKGNDLVGIADIRKKLDPAYNAKQIVVPKLEAASRVEPSEFDPIQVKKVKLTSNKQREISYLKAVQAEGLVSVINTHLELGNILSFVEGRMRYLKQSLLPVITYEVSRLLIKHPLLNAYYQNEALFLYNRINVGFAVDIDKGLKVVKIADTNNKSVYEIEEEIIRLSEAYLDGKLLTEDVTGIGFTITDLSGEGVASFQPLINKNNSAILGIAAVDKKLNRMNLSLAFDHRVTDGREAARFLSALKIRVESFQSNLAVGEPSDSGKAVACHRCFKKLSDDADGIGFVACITPQGAAAYLCQACIKGF